MVKVDLTKKPYFLEKEDIQWVEDTIAEMTTEEKIGDRKSTRLNSSHLEQSRMPSSA